MKYSDKYRNWFDRDDLVADLMIEAADDIDERDSEIERLREALQGLFTVVENAFPNLLNTEPMKKARDALKGDE